MLRIALFMVFYPSRNTAPWKFHFKKQGSGKFVITIEDDGIGFIKAQEHVKTGHKSLGTSTIKNILEINSN